jgi:putative acetyltransferase
MSVWPNSLSIRFTEAFDAPYLKEWLSDRDVLKGFPLQDEKEIDDAIRIWMSYEKKKSSLTALWDGVPCGCALLNIQTFQKLAHTCILTIIVDKAKRNHGIGSILLSELTKLAKDSFHIEVLHLEVYKDNPAIRLYERMGFKVFGEQQRFTKEEDSYRSKIFMQKILKTTPFHE